MVKVHQDKTKFGFSFKLSYICSTVVPQNNTMQLTYF